MEMKLMLLVFLLTITSLGQSQSFTIEEYFGVAHDWQPVEFSFNGSTSGKSMIGPNGQEVAFQKLSSSLIIRARLPASSLSRTWGTFDGLDSSSDTWICTSKLCPRDGEIVQIKTISGNLSTPLSEGVNYFAQSYNNSSSYRFYFNKARTSLVNWNSNPKGTFVVVSNGWVTDPDDASYDSLCCPQHSYLTGDPISIRCTFGNVLPSPLICNTTYYVIKTGNSTLKLASSYSNATNNISIDITQSTWSNNQASATISELVVAWTWTLTSATPTATVSNAVALQDKGDYYEMKNGLTGVRVLKPQGNPSFNKIPLNGVLLADGTTWIAKDTLFASSTNVSAILDYSVTIIENGPLKTTIQGTFTVDVPYKVGAPLNILAVDINEDTIALSGSISWTSESSVSFSTSSSLPCGLQTNKIYWPVTVKYNSAGDRTLMTLSEIRPNGPVVDLTCTGSGQIALTSSLNGTGFVIQTITMYAGHKSIIIEDDQELPFSYYIDFYSAGTFQPNLIRFRGTASDSIQCGYQFASDGSTIPASDPSKDSLIDVAYKYRLPSTTCSYDDVFGSYFVGGINWDISNSPAGSGWYYMLYKNNSASSYPMIGAYLGRNSRTLGLLMPTPSVWTNTGPNIGYGWYNVYLGLLRSSQQTRREWALYIATNADVPSDYSTIPPVALERNKMAGMGLTRFAMMDMTFKDPTTGWLPYKGQDQAVWNKLISQITAPDGSFYAYALNASPDARDFLNLAKYNNSLTVDLVISELQTGAHKIARVLVSELGNFDSTWTYDQVAQFWTTNMWRVPVALGNPLISSIQQRRLKSVASFLASTVWDEEFVPYNSDTRQTLNSLDSWEYSSSRALSSYALQNHSLMASLRNFADYYIDFNYDNKVNENGIPLVSTWFMEGIIEPFVSIMLDDVANTEAVTTFNWDKIGRYLLQILTPPEPRFGSNRKVVSLGEGNTYSSSLHGIMATMLKTINPTTSKNLQWAWEAQGSKYKSNSMPSLLLTDPDWEAIKPELASEDFPGYMSVLRHGFDTPHETVAWFINGDWKDPSRHYDDGHLTIYAHNTPLCIDWNADVNNPNVNAQYMHSSVIPDSGQWDSDRPPVSTAGSYNGGERASSFASFSFSSFAKTSFMYQNASWVRSIGMVATNPAFPVMVVKDDYTGLAQNGYRILTWNFMANGSVNTTDGLYTPTARIWPDLPSSGLLNYAPPLAPFQFTGQNWPAHPNGGINWNVYVWVPNNNYYLYFIGNWGHNAHNEAEKQEYQEANRSPFTEQQHIMRIKTNLPLYSIIIPFEKGSSFSGQVIYNSTSNCGFSIGQEITCLSDNGYTFRNSSTKIFTAFGSTKMYFDNNNTIIEGGPAEVIYYSNSEATIRISGPKGKRNFTLTNGPWYGPGLTSLDGVKVYQVDYQQDTVLTLSVSKSATPSPTPSITPTVTPSKTPTPSITPSSSTTPVILPAREDEKKSKDNSAVIIGAAAGGGAGLLIVLIAAILLLKFRKREDDLPPAEPMHINPRRDSIVPWPEHYQRLRRQTEAVEMQKLSSERMALIQNWNIKYEDITFERQIGRGAFGVVFKGVWKGVEVAIKQMATDNEDHVSTIQEFFAEAELMTQLRFHPNITQILGLCAKPPCLVTEFIHNGSLWDWLQNHQLESYEMISIARGIAKGMVYLHSEGVIHRDLAARNILLDKDLNPKVSDFGMSRVALDNRTNKTMSDIGPIRWMAPEAMKNRVYNKKTDVWSYGTVLCEIMTRQIPYFGMDLMQVAAQVLLGQISIVQDIEENADNYPPILVTIFRYCLNMDPEARPTFEEILKAFDNE